MNMKEKEISWNSVNGYRQLHWGNTVGGLIDPDPIWKKRLPAGISHGQVLISDDQCYAMDSQHKIHSISLSDGQDNWNLKLEPNDYFMLSNIFSMDKYLLAGSYVIDTEKGKLVNDLSQLTGDLVLSNGSPSELHNGKIFMQINGAEAPGKILIYEPAVDHAEIVDIGIVNLCMPDENITYGWKPTGDGYILKSYNFTTTENKPLNPEVKLGRLIAESNHLLVMNENDITMIDLSDGNILWSRRTDSLMDSLDPKQNGSYRIAMSEETLGIYYLSHFIQIDRIDGKTLWKKDFGKHNLDVGLVGDLIYAAFDIYESLGKLTVKTAIDRYTGEELWTENTKHALNNVKASENKVLFVSVYGEIVCYEWDDSNPYHSPTMNKV